MQASRGRANQVAIALTVAYWIGTVPLGMSLVNYSPPWFWIGWSAAVLFFAIPLTAILWILLPLCHVARFGISERSLRAQRGMTSEGFAGSGAIGADPERIAYYVRYSGSVVARGLAESAAVDALPLEAGGDDDVPAVMGLGPRP